MGTFTWANKRHTLKADKMKLVIIAACVLLVRGAPVVEVNDGHDDDMKDLLNRPINNFQIINNNLVANINVAVGNTQTLAKELPKELTPEQLKHLEPMVIESHLQYGVADDVIDKLVDILLKKLEIFDILIDKIPSETVKSFLRNFIRLNVGAVRDALKQGGMQLFEMLKDMVMKMIMG